MDPCNLPHSLLPCLQNCIKTYVYKQYHSKWFQILSSSFFAHTHTHTHTHSCTHTYTLTHSHSQTYTHTLTHTPKQTAKMSESTHSQLAVSLILGHTPHSPSTGWHLSLKIVIKIRITITIHTSIIYSSHTAGNMKRWRKAKGGGGGGLADLITLKY